DAASNSTCTRNFSGATKSVCSPKGGKGRSKSLRAIPSWTCSPAMERMKSRRNSAGVDHDARAILEVLCPRDGLLSSLHASRTCRDEARATWTELRTRTSVHASALRSNGLRHHHQEQRPDTLCSWRDAPCSENNCRFFRLHRGHRIRGFRCQVHG